MISKVVITPSEKKSKLYTAHIVNEDGKVRRINFGDPKGEHYPTHRDPIKKQNYIARHQVNEDWTDPYTAGFWSRFILWNYPTLEKSVKDTEKKINAPVYLFKEM